MLINAVLETANIEMTGRMFENGSPGAAASMTFTSGDESDSASVPTGTSATAMTATTT